MPSCEIAGLYGSSIFSFLRNFHILIFIVAALCYIPTNSTQESPHILTSMCWFFYYSFFSLLDWNSCAPFCPPSVSLPHLLYSHLEGTAHELEASYLY
jgi:hypothetical protein